MRRGDPSRHIVPRIWSALCETRSHSTWLTVEPVSIVHTRQAGWAGSTDAELGQFSGGQAWWCLRRSLIMSGGQQLRASIVHRAALSSSVLLARMRLAPSIVPARVTSTVVHSDTARSFSKKARRVTRENPLLSRAQDPR
jgi:hypothetical protein